jgi:hypothetical protein
MEFYTSTESHSGFEDFHLLENKTVESFKKIRPKVSFKKQKKFSNLSAEERWIFTRKIIALQKLINEIQTSKEPKIDTTEFSLEEILEVLNVRHAMHKY